MSYQTNLKGLLEVRFPTGKTQPATLSVSEYDSQSYLQNIRIRVAQELQLENYKRHEPIWLDPLVIK